MMIIIMVTVISIYNCDLFVLLCHMVLQKKVIRMLKKSKVDGSQELLEKMQRSMDQSTIQ